MLWVLSSPVQTWTYLAGQAGCERRDAVSHPSLHFVSSVTFLEKKACAGEEGGGGGKKVDVFFPCRQSLSPLIGSGGSVSDQWAPRRSRGPPGPERTALQRSV